MNWPTPQDYREAVQAPGLAFADPDLRAARAETDRLGLPRPVTGGFASVYKQFKTLDELVDEARAVIDAMRYEAPGQGRLFVEPRAAAAAAAAAAAGAAPNGGATEPAKPVRKRAEPPRGTARAGKGEDGE